MAGGEFSRTVSSRISEALNHRLAAMSVRDNTQGHSVAIHPDPEPVIFRGVCAESLYLSSFSLILALD